jgi:hypothetical protein
MSSGLSQPFFRLRDAQRAHHRGLLLLGGIFGDLDINQGKRFLTQPKAV